MAVFVGKNPWQSHGFQRARPILRDISADPNRALIVIDPRRTETAEMADYHLRVRPGTDAFCLAAILGTLVQEDLIDHDFIRDRTENGDELFAVLKDVPVADYCGRAGLGEESVREVARRIARASSVSVYEDLGIEQSLHSTLNSYLEKLLFAMTGNLGKRGAMNAGTSLIGLSQRRVVGPYQPRRRTSHHRRHDPLQRDSRRNPDRPSEALSRDDDRKRQPAFTRSPTARGCARRCRRSNSSSCIDVAMTESARMANYVLPASSQYEKWEATFFGAPFQTDTHYANTFTLRAPILDPHARNAAEGEIHRRLVRAIGAMTDDDVAPLHAAAAKGQLRLRDGVDASRCRAAASGGGDDRPFCMRRSARHLARATRTRRRCGVSRTTSRAGIRSRFAAPGFSGEAHELGEALFDAILKNRSGVVVSVDPYDETWRQDSRRADQSDDFRIDA